MKYYKLLTEQGYPGNCFIMGKIYPENYVGEIGLFPISIYALAFFKDWQEVHPSKYFVQEGKLPENYIVECNNAEESSKGLNSNNGRDIKWNHCRYCYTYKDDYIGFRIEDSLKNCPEDYILFSFEQWDQIVNKNKMKEEVMKKIIGWKLKEDCEQYKQVALNIVNNFNFHNFVEGYNFSTNSINERILKQAGVLELWFTPVYKEKTLQFGGYDVIFEKVASGVRITCNGETGTFSQIEAIYNIVLKKEKMIFGSQEVKQISYSDDTYWSSESLKAKPASIKIGCTAGTWEEFTAIYEKAKSML